MTENPATETTYRIQINRVLTFITEHLDESPSLAELADVAGFSPFHFHRIFAAYVGEPLGEYIRRSRLQRAAVALWHTDHSVIDIGLAAGFETPSAFSRAFRQHFGVSPSTLRRVGMKAFYESRMLSEGETDQRNQDNGKPNNLSTKRSKTTMQAEIRTLSDQKVYYAQGTGIDGNDFTRAAQAAFAVMNRWIADHHLHDKIVVCLGITPDDSSMTPADQARYDAGFIFNPDPGLAAQGDVQIQTLPAGRWAVFVHTGPYSTVWQSWNAIYRQWLPGSGHELRDTPPYEVYVDDPGQVAAETLRTEIFIPIK